MLHLILLALLFSGCRINQAKNSSSAKGDKGINTYSDPQAVCSQAADGAGHDTFDGRPYDVLNYNCHSAANAGVRNDPMRTGILVCQGYADRGDPYGHTFNYRLYGDRTEFHNWGEVCNSPATSNPPDVNDDANMGCIAQFCGNQFDGANQRSLPPGRQVEEPGPLFCSQNTAGRGDCDRCCQYRGKWWDQAAGDIRPGDVAFVQFMSQCYSECAKKPNRLDPNGAGGGATSL